MRRMDPEEQKHMLKVEEEEREGMQADTRAGCAVGGGGGSGGTWM